MTGKKLPEENFGALAEQWLKNAKFHIKESSYVKYYNLMRNHVLPVLGEIPLGELTTERVERFVEEKLKNGRLNGKGGLSEKTVKDMLLILREIGSFAVCQDIELPCRMDLVRVRTKEKEVQILERKEQDELVKFLMSDNELPRTGVLLSLYMGLRLGEVCALKKENLKMETGILQVRKTMQRIQSFDEDSKRKTKVIVTEPKSVSSIRDIPIPDFLMQRLGILEHAAQESYLLTGSPDWYVEPRTMENIFKSYLKKCQIQNTNFHALRHTFATRCIECGFDVKSLSEILGHANVNITLNRYVHSSIEQKRQNMKLLTLY